MVTRNLLNGLRVYLDGEEVDRIKPVTLDDDTSLCSSFSLFSAYQASDCCVPMAVVRLKLRDIELTQSEVGLVQRDDGFAKFDRMSR